MGLCFKRRPYLLEIHIKIFMYEFTWYLGFALTLPSGAGDGGKWTRMWMKQDCPEVNGYCSWTKGTERFIVPSLYFCVCLVYFTQRKEKERKGKDRKEERRKEQKPFPYGVYFLVFESVLVVASAPSSGNMVLRIQERTAVKQVQ